MELPVSDITPPVYSIVQLLSKEQCDKVSRDDSVGKVIGQKNHTLGGWKTLTPTPYTQNLENIKSVVQNEATLDELCNVFVMSNLASYSDNTEIEDKNYV